MEKNLRLLLRLSSSFTTLNCKVDEYSLEEIKMKRQIGPVTCVVMDNWTSSRRGREEKRLLKISGGTLHTIDQDEWKSNKREEQRRSNEASEKRAKIVKLV